MEPKQSGARNAAIAGVTATQAVTLLLYTVHRFGIDDMTPEVAAAIIGVSTAVASMIYHEIFHFFDRRRMRNEKANRGVTGGAPAAAPVGVSNGEPPAN